MRSLDEKYHTTRTQHALGSRIRLITGIIMFQPCWKGEQVDQERLWLSFIIHQKMEKTNGKEPSGQEQRAVSLAAVGLGAGHTLTSLSHSQQSRSSSCPGHLLKLGTCPVQVWKVTEEDPAQPMGRKRPILLFQSRTKKGGCASYPVLLAPPWVPGDVTHIIKE